jgi:hypothetical protein
MMETEDGSYLGIHLELLAQGWLGPHHHPVAWKVGLFSGAVLLSRGTSHEHGRSYVL